MNIRILYTTQQKKKWRDRGRRHKNEYNLSKAQYPGHEK